MFDEYSVYCVGGVIFKQNRGVHTESNCSSLLADIILLHCEFVFKKNLLSNKKLVLPSCCHTPADTLMICTFSIINI